jgi:hypothetical protein
VCDLAHRAMTVGTPAGREIDAELNLATKTVTARRL